MARGEAAAGPVEGSPVDGTPDQEEGIGNHSDPVSTSTPTVRGAKMKTFGVCFAYFMAGMNDASTGALIPYIRRNYTLSLSLVSIIYLLNFTGWLLSAIANTHLYHFLGMGGTLVVGSAFQASAYALIFWPYDVPYPLFAAAFLLSGLGVGIQDAQVNTFIASVHDAHFWLGILHGMYGLGALVSPLIATAIATRTEFWRYFYLIMFSLMLFNTLSLAWGFRTGLFRKAAESAEDDAGKDLKAAVRERVVWILSAFFFLYVGAEVTTGGWLVSYLILIRRGKPSEVGYISSAYWGGLTLGRMLLANITNRFGERRMIFCYLGVAVAMQLIFWLVPSIIGDAIAISILGFAIGPFFPTGLSILSKILPAELHVPAIGISSTLGQAGSAFFPLITGLIANRVGLRVLEPIIVSLLGGVGVLWWMMPRVKERNEQGGMEMDGGTIES